MVTRGRSSSEKLDETIHWQNHALLLLVFVSCIIYFVETYRGIGILPDSTRYFRLGPEPYDAPLYTWVLDAIVAFGLSYKDAAYVLGLVLLCANVFLIWHILLRTSGSVLASAFATGIIILSPHFTGGHAVAMSEPLFIFGCLVSILCFFEAIKGHRNWLVLTGVAVGLTTLARFNGAALGFAFGLCFLINRTNTVKNRIIDASLFALTSLAVFGGWALLSKLLTGQAAGREIAFNGTADAEQWMQGLSALSILILPPQIPLFVRLVVLLIVALLSIWVISASLRTSKLRERASRTEADWAILALSFFALSYLAFIILSALIEAYLPFNGRYALPFYVFATMAIAIASTRFFEKPARSYARLAHAAALSGIVALLGIHVLRTGVRTADAMSEGIGFTSREWSQSELIAAVSKLPPDAKIFTNAPDALNFLTTYKTDFIPMIFKRRTGKDDGGRLFNEALSELNKTLQDGNSFVVFVDKIDWRFYLISEAELLANAPLVLKEKLNDGRIYSLNATQSRIN
jgi:hypothetical protein